MNAVFVFVAVFEVDIALAVFDALIIVFIPIACFALSDFACAIDANFVVIALDYGLNARVAARVNGAVVFAGRFKGFSAFADATAIGAIFVGLANGIFVSIVGLAYSGENRFIGLIFANARRNAVLAGLARSADANGVIAGAVR